MCGDFIMRSSGILLSVSSLPSEYPIGTLGKGAYDFVDFLSGAGQKYWQILPLTTIAYGNSPYQGFSAFAFNYYLIDADMLIKDGLLYENECAGLRERTDMVDYAKTINTIPLLLKKAVRRFDKSDKNYISFCRDNDFWLRDFSVFMAYKEKHSMLPLEKFPVAFRRRDKKVLSEFISENGELIDFYSVTQYLFWRQWIKLKKYANDNGVHIIGDIPIYVSGDSCDVWTQPQLFCVDENGRTILSAGCPPDDFSPGGQLWGNPVYRWEEHEKTDFDFWMKRLNQAYALYDVTRIDHFRGFYSFYAVPSGEITAENGKWIDAPGERLMEKLKRELPEMKIIAEDLGFITPKIRERMDKSGFPGMKIIQFGFDSGGENEHLPHNFEKNSVAYTGTHDNMTVVGWMLSAKSESLNFAMDYFGVGSSSQLPEAMIRGALSSVSDTVIIPIQDYLHQNNSARMNVPSTVGDNWRYRIKHEDMNEKLSEKLKRQGSLYARLEERKN